MATRLKVGDRAPDFTLLAVRGEQITEVSLQSLLASRRGLVLTTYLLDFSGG